MTAQACTLERPAPMDSEDGVAAVTELAASELVARAREGDSEAWDALVERYSPLIWSICRKHRLGRTDSDDVAQSVWLRLVDQLDKVRDPAALRSEEHTSELQSP